MPKKYYSQRELRGVRSTIKALDRKLLKAKSKIAFIKKNMKNKKKRGLKRKR